MTIARLRQIGFSDTYEYHVVTRCVVAMPIQA